MVNGQLYRSTRANDVLVKSNFCPMCFWSNYPLVISRSHGKSMINGGLNGTIIYKWYPPFFSHFFSVSPVFSAVNKNKKVSILSASWNMVKPWPNPWNPPLNRTSNHQQFLPSHENQHRGSYEKSSHSERGINNGIPPYKNRGKKPNFIKLKLGDGDDLLLLSLLITTIISIIIIMMIIG